MIAVSIPVEGPTAPSTSGSSAPAVSTSSGSSSGNGGRYDAQRSILIAAGPDDRDAPIAVKDDEIDSR